ncbi:MAG: LysM peptidoglycan-binding domain-containing M23 family metallopeptidase [Anaerolineaceae bacterium]|nr:LysM peptidoglycan-binding domain-containing M23 family metallopeptidase [Anaerolineaceae bacterium]
MLFLAACQPTAETAQTDLQTEQYLTQEESQAEESAADDVLATERPQYQPGQLVDYVVQTGDTLPALAAHFNTSEAEIRAANSILPKDLTTLPAGLPLQIPIYYHALWGSAFQILPDKSFVNGPDAVDLNAYRFVRSHNGWLRNETTFGGGNNLSGGQIVDYVATNYSINPKLLLALLEYQSGALSDPAAPDFDSDYVLKINDPRRSQLILQLNSAASMLNRVYYSWREGTFDVIIHADDGRLEYPDPWQNAASVALQYYFSQTLPYDEYLVAISDSGFNQTYLNLFGDPWQNDLELIPGSLTQPELRLPFENGVPWTYTGGPHAGWGDTVPWAAIDFAPPGVKGCGDSSDWVTALADGVIARTGLGTVVLDLDGDGDERTGWVIFYLHLSSVDRVAEGAVVSAGQPIGHPSCEGGSSTGTHVHIGRKYNGEWIPASGILPFNLDGWTVYSSGEAYQGTLVRFSNVVIASDKSTGTSQIITSVE